MPVFILKNHLFEFDSKFYKQRSGTAIGTKFAPPYVCTLINHTETEFLKMKDLEEIYRRCFFYMDRK